MKFKSNPWPLNLCVKNLPLVEFNIIEVEDTFTELGIETDEFL